VVSTSKKLLVLLRQGGPTGLALTLLLLSTSPKLSNFKLLPKTVHSHQSQLTAIHVVALLNLPENYSALTIQPKSELLIAQNQALLGVNGANVDKLVLTEHLSESVLKSDI
jgi:hypothetical protein